VTTPYPRPGPEGTPDPTGWRLWTRRLLIPVIILGGLALIPAVGLALLWAFNPVGDEWQCSDGEAPAGNACYRTDQPLPAGLHWDPLGNRPMPYNCDKDGWTPIERDGSADRDCLNNDLPMPTGWHEAD
jgi:hypothetical protein